MLLGLGPFDTDAVLAVIVLSGGNIIAASTALFCSAAAMLVSGTSLISTSRKAEAG